MKSDTNLYTGYLFMCIPQFDPDILDICFMILDANPKYVSDADKDCSARRNPIYVTRVLSAMVGPPPCFWKSLDPIRMAVNQPVNGFSVGDYHGARENFLCAYIYSALSAGKTLPITLRLSLFLRATRFCDRNMQRIRALKQQYALFLLKNHSFKIFSFFFLMIQWLIMWRMTPLQHDPMTPWPHDTAQTAGLM